MKRRLLIAILCSAVICSVGALAACGDGNEDNGKDEHAHTWDGGEITTPATCSEKGVKTYKCTECGEKKEEAVPETNEHPYSEVWLKNDEEHWHAVTCKHSGERANVAAHEWGEGEVIKQASCIQTGLVKYTCVCGMTKSQPVKKTEHGYSSEWSYDEDGHWLACTTEGCTAVSAEHAHNWDGGEITTPATCLKTGVKTYTCTDCKATKDEVIGLTDHDFETKWIYDEDGSGHYHVCATQGCNEKDEEQAHTYGAWSTEGRIYRECTECGKPEYAPSLTMVEESSEWYERLTRVTVTVGGGVNSALNVMSKVSCYHTVTYSGSAPVGVVCEYYDKDGNPIRHEYTLSPENPSFTELLPDRAIACVFIESDAETAFECTFSLSVSETLPNHTHTFATEWSTDDTWHWHACTGNGCEEEEDVGTHDLVGGTCTVCGYKQNQEEQ